MDFTKKELVNICKYYFPEKTKTYFNTAPKPCLEYLYEEIIYPDIMESNSPNFEIE
jgi:hypothetical protein